MGCVVSVVCGVECVGVSVVGSLGCVCAVCGVRVSVGEGVWSG